MFIACLGSGFGENGITDASISVTWLPLVDMNVPTVWSNVMWAMRVFMGASSFSKLFTTARQRSVFARHTVD